MTLCHEAWGTGNAGGAGLGSLPPLGDLGQVGLNAVPW